MELLRGQTSPVPFRTSPVLSVDNEHHLDLGFERRTESDVNPDVDSRMTMNGHRKSHVDGSDGRIHYIDDDDGDNDEMNESDVDDNDEHSGISSKSENCHRQSSSQTEIENGYGPWPREDDRPKQLYVHSYRPTSTKPWKRWASKVAETSNLGIALRNISLFHGLTSLLLAFMSCIAIVCRSYMSFLALPIWCSIFLFFPSCVIGLRAYKHLPHRPNAAPTHYLMTISILSAILSAMLSVVYAVFIYRDGQLEIECKPRPSGIMTSTCREQLYRVLINVLFVFLFIVELIPSVFSLGVCCILRNACSASSIDTERLVSRSSTRMSYKRLETEEEDEFLEELGNLSPPPSRSLQRNDDRDGQGGTKYARSVSAPTLLPNRTTQLVAFAD